MKSIRVALLAAVCLAALALLPGCPSQKDAFSASQISYTFGSSRLPWSFEVWNSNPSVNLLNFRAKSSVDWLRVEPQQGTSAGPSDRRVITVYPNRQGLAKGTYYGYVELTATGVKPLRIEISLYSDGSESGSSGLSLSGVTENYSSPYLLDFAFSLHDKDGLPVIADLSQFTAQPSEDGVPTSLFESPPYLVPATDKQSRFFLVFDYTLSMALSNGDSDGDGISDAIEAMEEAAKQVFLPALTGDAQVGVYEFHNAQTDPQKIAGLTIDKAYVARRIDRIWSDYTFGRWGSSRCWDAIYSAALEFDGTNQNDENRNIIVLSDGKDTSSTRTYQQAAEAARERNVRVHCIRFGTELDAGALQHLAAQTNGTYFGAVASADIGAGFSYIVDELDAQYVLRWATPERRDIEFLPSFGLTLGGNQVFHTAANRFDVPDFAGDELVGLLRTVPSKSEDQTTAVLRAMYVPRFIWRLKFFASSPYPFTVTQVASADGGICGGWAMTTEPDAVLGGTWIRLVAPSETAIMNALPFAAFGPILKFDFDAVLDEDVDPFDTLYVDNTPYDDNTPYYAGQVFEIQGRPNVLPGG